MGSQEAALVFVGISAAVLVIAILGILISEVVR